MNTLNSIIGTDKVNAIITGTLFIIADVSAIIGLKLYDPVLNNPDYLISGAAYSNQIVLGALFELILAVSAVGTGVMLYPYLKKYSESLGLGYVCFRMLEVVFILIGIISVLVLLTLSNQFSTTKVPDQTVFNAIGETLKSIHRWTFILGPNFMLGINTFVYSYVFFKSELVPTKIAILGMVGAGLIFVAALLEMFGVFEQVSVWGVLLALPIFVYELVLGFWLIVRGFKKNALLTFSPISRES